MTNVTEQNERAERAARLRSARAAKFSSAKKAAERHGWNVNTYKAHEAGRNGFGLADARAYAKAFGVSLNWLNFNIGAPGDEETTTSSLREVRLISWVSAGEIVHQDTKEEWGDYPTLFADLPDGEWFALRVDGPSMNKISPPDSVIFADRRDTRLVPNACYIIADETGAATYKRYRPSENPVFQPASYEDIAPPKLDGAITVVARVKRSMIDM